MRFIAGALLAGIALCASAFGYEMNEGAKAFTSVEGYKAAYFGEVTKLEAWIKAAGGFEKMHWGNGNHEINSTLGWALKGHQPEVPKLFIRLGYPTTPSDADEIFALPEMDVATAKVFNANLPDFAKNYGVSALRGAIKADHSQVVDYLLEQGANPDGTESDGLAGVQLLLEAVHAGDRGIVDALLKHGADPYARGVMGFALRVKSAELVRFLDRQHRYDKEASEFEKQFAPPPGSPFPGVWVYQKEGFGSSAFYLRKDGTGSMFGDVGGMALTWRGERDLISIYQFDPEKGIPSLQPAIQARLSEDHKSLRPLEPLDPAHEVMWTKTEASNVVVGREPEYVRVEAVRISLDFKSMALQINGRHIQVPLAAFLKASQSGRHAEADEPKNENMIKWTEFKDGPIDPSTVAGWLQIPTSERSASLAYSMNWEQLGFDHETKATTLESSDYTLFSCGEERWNDEYAPGYVLFSNQPLQNGKRVMFFFLERRQITQPPRTPL